MNTNPQLDGYAQEDIKRLYTSGSIVPTIDSYGNLNIQNVTGQMYSSSITIPLVNLVYNQTKVATIYDPSFTEL